MTQDVFPHSPCPSAPNKFENVALITESGSDISNDITHTPKKLAQVFFVPMRQILLFLLLLLVGAVCGTTPSSPDKCVEQDVTDLQAAFNRCGSHDTCLVFLREGIQCDAGVVRLPRSNHVRVSTLDDRYPPTIRGHFVVTRPNASLTLQNLVLQATNPDQLFLLNSDPSQKSVSLRHIVVENNRMSGYPRGFFDVTDVHKSSIALNKVVDGAGGERRGNRDRRNKKRGNREAAHVKIPYLSAH